MAEIVGVPPLTGPGSMGTDRPRWTVAIPVHNCADYLSRALPEVLAQLGDRDDAEILVLDDNSTDDPGGVVERLGRGKVRFSPNPGHLGAIGTFNRCLELSTGHLVHLLHGDDAVRPGFYRAMEDAMTPTGTAARSDRTDPAAGPPPVAALCRTRDVDEDGRPRYTSRSYRAGTGVWTDALDALALSNRVRAPGIVVRRTGYEQVGGFRTDLPHAADWEMWTRLAAHGAIVFVDQVLADYRKHGTSDTSARVRTGANVRERVTAIAVVAAYVPAGRRRRTTRRALAYSIYFAARTATSLVRAGDWSAAGRQAREAARCLWLLPQGVLAAATPTLR